MEKMRVEVIDMDLDEIITTEVKKMIDAGYPKEDVLRQEAELREKWRK